ncbi:hypothetical protein ACTMTI_25395 [Nonomuraea sp. H19]|uniref:hypothetical protein n=1 Tax=Nonomuraea sp. H19 TaxID=3452206 RepID=UPI003F8AF2A4
MVWWRVEVIADVWPRGVRGLTVRVPGEPEGSQAPGGAVAPPPEYDDDVADPGGCEF